MKQALTEALIVLISQAFLGSYVLQLVEFRSPERKWRRYWLIAVSVLVIGHVLWIAAGNYSLYRRIGTFSLLIPYMLITLFCSRYRDARTLFSVSNASYIGCICGINGYAAQLLFPALPFLPLVVRVLSLIGMYFVTRQFARTCRAMFRQMEHGWLVLWMLPLTTSLISFTISAWFLGQQPLLSFIAVYGLLIVCGAAYYLMYLFFEQIYTQKELETGQKILSLQVSALQSRIEATYTAEERLRIDRHDLRHRLELVRELVQRGNSDDALAFVDKAQEKLNDSTPVKWCRPPVLDAMFASYFNQAAAHGIRVDARLELPERLPVDEGELAIILANALENAIHACIELPEQQRELRCTVISQPSLMLEVSNPCRRAVRFDSEGLPIARKEGHGLGTRSIAAFCQKYNAVFQFKQTDNDFIVQIIL